VDTSENKQPGYLWPVGVGGGEKVPKSPALRVLSAPPLHAAPLQMCDIEHLYLKSAKKDGFPILIKREVNVTFAEFNDSLS